MGPSLDRLQDRLLEMRAAAPEHRFITDLRQEELASASLRAYLVDTGWAVHLFPAIVQAVSDAMPSSIALSRSAAEETRHPALYDTAARLLFDDLALGPCPDPAWEGVTPIYRAFWSWISDLASHSPVAALVAITAIEATSSAFEGAVVDALADRCRSEGLAWFALHSGPVEARHASEGLHLLQQQSDEQACDIDLFGVAAFAAHFMTNVHPTSILILDQ